MKRYLLLLIFAIVAVVKIQSQAFSPPYATFKSVVTPQSSYQSPKAKEPKTIIISCYVEQLGFGRPTLSKVKLAEDDKGPYVYAVYKGYNIWHKLDSTFKAYLREYDSYYHQDDSFSYEAKAIGYVFYFK